MGRGQSPIQWYLFLFLFAASVPIAIKGLLDRNDALLLLGAGMGIVALFIRRFMQKP